MASIREIRPIAQSGSTGRVKSFSSSIFFVSVMISLLIIDTSSVLSASVIPLDFYEAKVQNRILIQHGNILPQYHEFISDPVKASSLNRKNPGPVSIYQSPQVYTPSRQRPLSLAVSLTFIITKTAFEMVLVGFLSYFCRAF